MGNSFEITGRRIRTAQVIFDESTGIIHLQIFRNYEPEVHNPQPTEYTSLEYTLEQARLFLLGRWDDPEAHDSPSEKEFEEIVRKADEDWLDGGEEEVSLSEAWTQADHERGEILQELTLIIAQEQNRRFTQESEDGSGSVQESG
jgi:hypothetical protein